MFVFAFAWGIILFSLAGAKICSYCQASEQTLTLLQVSALLEVMSVECGLLSRMYMVYFGDLGADNVAAVLLFAKYSITLSSLN